MEFDDEIREHRGLAVSARDMGDGTVRIFFDDIEADGTTTGRHWRHSHFVTFSSPVDNDSFLNSDVSEAFLQDIGLLVVARLSALRRQHRSPGA